MQPREKAEHSYYVVCIQTRASPALCYLLSKFKGLTFSKVQLRGFPLPLDMDGQAHSVVSAAASEWILRLTWLLSLLTPGFSPMMAAKFLAQKPVIKPDDGIILIYVPGLDFITAFFGCLRAKVLPVPALPPDPLQRECHVLVPVLPLYPLPLIPVCHCH
ncbi:hypothetical protein TIFTF001_007225 [Ficus carica]|uniref:Uncharacterized protein n=1 Tax=Ficus carica TaxID=3494 RepID=A0AA87ZPL6_FICCA|nr:hypothetical protein TIFTF001_007225 [Ficus carica]